MKLKPYQTMEDLSYYNNFAISDIDDASNPKYYGKLSKDGSWIIMREDTTTGEYRYCSGEDDYPTNWTNRATLTYDYFNVGV